MHTFQPDGAQVLFLLWCLAVLGAAVVVAVRSWED